MLDIVFILLFLLALMMLIMSIAYERHPFWNMTAGFISSVTWLILGLSQLTIHRAYEVYNASSNQIETGTHAVWTAETPYYTYFFVGLFVVTQIYVWAMVWDYRINNQ